jgi:hypothetical protein
MKLFYSPYTLGTSQMMENGHETLVSASDIESRLSGKMELRSTESIGTALTKIKAGDIIQLAPDTWTYNGSIVIDKPCTIIGHPGATVIKRGSGLGVGPLLSITSDNVILQGITFLDDAETGQIVCIRIESETNESHVQIVDCRIHNFNVGISAVSGGSTLFAFNEIQVESIGIKITGDSHNNRINCNLIDVKSGGTHGILLESEVSNSSVCGNISSKKITFQNTGSAQTFSSPGGSSNHVSGNVATLEENT